MLSLSYHIIKDFIKKIKIKNALQLLSDYKIISTPMFIPSVGVILFFCMVPTLKWWYLFILMTRWWYYLKDIITHKRCYTNVLTTILFKMMIWWYLFDFIYIYIYIFKTIIFFYFTKMIKDIIISSKHFKTLIWQRLCVMISQKDVIIESSYHQRCHQKIKIKIK